MASMRMVLILATLAAALPALAADGYRVGERLAPAKSAPAANRAFREITWEALIPAGWDPMKAFKGVNLGKLKDSDPQAMEALQRMREEWDKAPVEVKLNGERVRLPGFIVPLDTNLDRVKEFLLVPYFGACIHVPPPPANQVVHVFVKKPLKNAQIMGAVWVGGTLETLLTETSFGGAGYRMQAESVAPYTKP